MIKSMTGFGYREQGDEGIHISTEIKALNTRYLDLMITLPHSLSVLEKPVREIMRKNFLRGRIEVMVRIHDTMSTPTLSVDEATALQWKNVVNQLGTIMGKALTISLDTLIQQEGILHRETQKDPQEYWPLLEELLIGTVKDVREYRQKEGHEIFQDIKAQLDIIANALSLISTKEKGIKGKIETSLRRRFKRIVGEELDEQRVLMELSSLIIKMDINEEIVRLKAHIAAFHEECQQDGPLGKRLDFLSQEMGREINTIGSKIQHTDISRQIVNMKDALEKIREQLRNVE